MWADSTESSYFSGVGVCVLIRLFPSSDNRGMKVTSGNKSLHQKTQLQVIDTLILMALYVYVYVCTS